jgi:adenylate cyclase
MESHAVGYRTAIESSHKHVTVVFGGVTVADSRRTLVVYETRLPPVYYIPIADVRMDLMEPAEYRTHCPFKGDASYWTLRVGDRVAENALWAYEEPLPEFERLAGHVAFYRNRMDGWVEESESVSIDPITDPHEHGNPLVDWLIRDAWEAASIGELTGRLARQLRGVGIPLARLNLLVRTLHPQVLGTLHRWSAPDETVVSSDLPHALREEERFLASPYVPIFARRGGVRRRLEDPDAALDFPILRELRAEGMTDYAAMPISFSDGQVHALTLATDAPGGFATEHLGHVHEILPLLSRLVEVHALRRTAITLLDTYLGTRTGARVLDGSIRRGDREEIPAVIWWADLRGSTGYQARLDRERYLELLNEFFESTAGSVLEQGGEVLKFIGDAVLAIFPARDDPDAPMAALRAARGVLAKLEARNALSAGADVPTLSAAIAVHLGEVSYGNIGVEGRLDFTVTGPAVNEVARLESLSKQLDKSVIASAAVAALAPGELVSLGTHTLRGVPDPMEVFTLRDLP